MDIDSNNAKAGSGQHPKRSTAGLQAGHFNAVIGTPFGALGIRASVSAIREIVYLPASFTLQAPDNVIATEAARQIARYFHEPDFRFDLPLDAVGSTFQQKVWLVISAIPRGEVLTYGEVARRIGSAPRAVGQA